MRKFAEVQRRVTVVALVVVAATAAGCGGDDSVTDPEPPPPPPASVGRHAPADSSQSATVGTLVPVAPAVLVLSAGGAPVRGVTVTFAVASGSGSITGASVATGPDGVAAVGSWRLGTTAGRNTLTATVLPLPPVIFQASGRAGPAATLVKTNELENVRAFVGRYVYPPPFVRVVDQYGNAVAGSDVTFAVMSGGGSVTGPFQPTNSEGITSTFTWKVGDVPGPNTLQASVAGLTPVLFTVTAIARCTATAMAFESSVAGTLASPDCTEGRFFYDHYGITLPATTAVAFTMTSPDVDSYLILYDDQDRDFAGNDDVSESSLDSRIKALLPAGYYEPVATTYLSGQSGRYDFSARSTSASIDNCEEVWALPGIVTAQSIASTDCVDYYYGSNYDWVLLVLRAGETITFSMEGAAWPTYMALYASDGFFAQQAEGSLTVTPVRDALYGLYLSPNEYGHTGAYTLRIDRAATVAGRVGAARPPVLQRSEKGLGSVRAVRDAMRAGRLRAATRP